MWKMVFQDSSLLLFYLLLQMQTSLQCDPAVKGKKKKGVEREINRSLTAFKRTTGATDLSNYCSRSTAGSKHALIRGSDSTPKITPSCFGGTSEGHLLPAPRGTTAGTAPGPLEAGATVASPGSRCDAAPAETSPRRPPLPRLLRLQPPLSRLPSLLWPLSAQQISARPPPRPAPSSPPPPAQPGLPRPSPRSSAPHSPFKLGEEGRGAQHCHTLPVGLSRAQGRWMTSPDPPNHIL